MEIFRKYGEATQKVSSTFDHCYEFQIKLSHDAIEKHNGFFDTNKHYSIPKGYNKESR